MIRCVVVSATVVQDWREGGVLLLPHTTKQMR